MPLSWNEIRDRALAFSKEWADEESEDAEAKTFWDSFFNLFGITRRRVASFETPVKKGDGRGGFIDLLWRGTLLVEHKSRGKDLDSAFHQATEYFPGIKERALPRYVVVSDFARIRLRDLESDESHEFPLSELHQNVRRFAFIAGYETRSYGEEDPVNVRAAQWLGDLHDLLSNAGYEGHELEVYLVRLLFCLFADDTSIFETGAFREYIDQRTAEDGSDLGIHLAQLFQVLNSPVERRHRTLDEQLGSFPYVDGKLFEEVLTIASFNCRMRDVLLDCASLNWSRINPAIFGSLFQSIRDRSARRQLGAHYTSEGNILKLLTPLFLDDLRAEFQRARRDVQRLQEFHKKLESIRIFDPACGCGNFLVVSYRELRLLELEVLRELYKKRPTQFINVGLIVRVNVDQFYGIEIDEWPAQIAQVALWLTDHQMNMRVSEEFGQYFVRLPLSRAPAIVRGDALELDWQEVLDPQKASYIVGNPPYAGKKEQSKGQKAQVQRLFKDVKGGGVLDYVSCWYRLAVEYLQKNPRVRMAFVSTNSITQGEQVGVLWQWVQRQGAVIHFAHRTFAWTSEARGRAAVHVVIVGLTLNQDVSPRWLFDYPELHAASQALKVDRINAYLVAAPDVFIPKRSAPLCTGAMRMDYGSMPIDDGWLTLEPEDRARLLAKEPAAAPYIRQYVGGVEYIKWDQALLPLA